MKKRVFKFVSLVTTYALLLGGVPPITTSAVRAWYAGSVIG